MTHASGSDQIEIKAFVNGIMKIRGHASGLDAQTLLIFSQLIFERTSRALDAMQLIQSNLCCSESKLQSSQLTASECVPCVGENAHALSTSELLGPECSWSTRWE